jgi:maltooligosyltrehalose trehalohydrolase
MLFMGEEYGERAPFQYFVDHSDPELIEAVRKGRREEFAAFEWKGEMPDPCAPETFDRCVLEPDVSSQPPHRDLLAWHMELLSLRRQWAADLASLKREVYARPLREANAIEVHYCVDGEVQRVMFLNFNSASQEIRMTEPGKFAQVLDSSDARWGGPFHGPRHQSVENHVMLRPW